MKLTGLTNLFGTLTAILTTVSGILVSMGCASGATDFASTCAISWLPPSATAIVAMVFGVITFVLKLSRPGGVLHSLFGGTAVINSTPSVGTVTPEQVAKP
jgi:hypothetical protein